MQNKVIFISIDGMRPDGFLQCGNPYIHELMKRSAYTLNAASMMPSVTLPCHLSMFHSVPPTRHGTLTNTYMPPVRPFPGLMEQIHNAGGRCAMFFGWEPMRDVSRPGSVYHSEFMWCYAREDNDAYLADRAIACLREEQPDFLYLYMVDVDDKGGHDNGWMTEAYLDRVNKAISCVQRVVEAFGDEYTIIITADHGGHERSHGTDMPEDMIIPLFFMGPAFTPGQVLEGLSLLDLAPTIATVMGVSIPREWEGKSVAKKA